MKRILNIIIILELAILELYILGFILIRIHNRIPGVLSTYGLGVLILIMYLYRVFSKHYSLLLNNIKNDGICRVLKLTSSVVKSIVIITLLFFIISLTFDNSIKSTFDDIIFLFCSRN